MPLKDILAQAIETAGNVVLTVVGDTPLPPSQSEFSYEYFIVPTTSLEQACLSLGHANVVPDGDGVVRRIPLIVKDSSGHTYPAFALAVLHALFSQPLPGPISKTRSVVFIPASATTLSIFAWLINKFCPSFFLGFTWCLANKLFAPLTGESFFTIALCG